MAYTGTPIDNLDPLKLRHSSCQLIIVSGDGPNVCGHMLVQMPAEPGGTDSVFHIAGGHDYPHWMPAASYPLYVKENGKTELGRKPIMLPRPRDAAIYLAKAIKEKWLWGGAVNNCVSFCEEYIAAGGADYSMWTNCPAQYDSQNPKEYVENWLQDVSRRAEMEIRRIYGLPF